MANGRYGEYGRRGRRGDPDDDASQSRREGYGDYPDFDEGRCRGNPRDRDAAGGGRGDDAPRSERYGNQGGGQHDDPSTYGGPGGGGRPHRGSEAYSSAYGRGRVGYSDWERERFGGEDESAGGRGAEGEHRGRGPQGYSRSDSRIEEDVNDRLTDDPHLDASEIQVAASQGEVTLSGQVSSRRDKRRAEDLADSVSGVKHVQNNLRVREGGTRGGNPGSSFAGP